MFGECTQQTIKRLERVTEASNGQGEVDMETEWLNLGLDIIGQGVFNYDFGSINSESPVIQAGLSGTKRIRRLLILISFGCAFYSLQLISL
eukprot:scaffold18051_cov22-Prasinocladus_malaysianus.AAC.1